MKELRTVLFWVITQQVVVISYHHFGTTYRSHPQGSKTLLRKLYVVRFSFVNATDEKHTLMV